MIGTPVLHEIHYSDLKFKPRKGERVDTPFRVDPYLQSQNIIGKVCLDKFTELGGKFFHMDPNDVKEQFLLLSNDIVYPSCTAGYCRSQALWAILSKYENITLFAPHATRYGFDPFNEEANWNKNLEEEAKTDEFVLWFKRDKAERFGYEKFSYLLVKHDSSLAKLEEIRAYYDQHYFGPHSIGENKKGARRVYITFAQNAHVILHRLNQTNQDLNQVVVVSLDLDDYITRPLEEWNTYCRSFAAYYEFSLVLNNMLNFTHLEDNLL
jgi:hypothetical protein